MTSDPLKLDKLRELVRTEAIDVVMCYSLDRLTRDPGHGVIITQELEKHGVKLEAVNTYLAKNLLVNLAAEFPEFRKIEDWRELTSDRINTSMIDKLHMVSHRKTFHESCEVSKSWQSEPCIPTSEAIHLFSELKADKGLKENTEKTNRKRLKPFAATFTFLPLDDDTIRQRFLKYYKTRSPRY